MKSDLLQKYESLKRECDQLEKRCRQLIKELNDYERRRQEYEDEIGHTAELPKPPTTPAGVTP